MQMSQINHAPIAEDVISDWHIFILNIIIIMVVSAVKHIKSGQNVVKVGHLFCFQSDAALLLAQIVGSIRRRKRMNTICWGAQMQQV